MADSEFVSMAQFGEFVKRMDDRFNRAHEISEERYNSINQRLADAEKARDQNLVHVNQRLDDLKESVNHRFEGVNQRFDSLEKLLNWHNRIVMGILAVILAAAVKYLFFPG